MSETKSISLQGLRTFLKPLMRIINKKAETWDDLKQKPFGSEWEEKVFIDNLSFTYEDNYPSCMLSSYVPLVENQIYTVVYDNVNYECIAYYFAGTDNPLCFGNASLLSSEFSTGNNEPFCVLSYDNQTEINGTEENMGTTHTVTISGTEETIKKLDGKYLDFDTSNLVKSVNGNTPDDYGDVYLTLSNISGNLPISKGGTGAGTATNALINLNAMERTNPTGSGSFSLNRKSGTTVGSYSVAEGYQCEASASYTHAEGRNTTSSGESSHTEGYSTTASGKYSHAEGYSTTSSGVSSHSGGYSCKAEGDRSFAFGFNSMARRRSEFIIGENNYTTENSGYFAEKEPGQKGIQFSPDAAETITTQTEPTIDMTEKKFVYSNTVYKLPSEIVVGDYICYDQHYYKITGKPSTYIVECEQINLVEGKSTKGKHAFVIGNGDSALSRSNAYTLDWSGNGWYQGSVCVGGENGDAPAATLAANGLILTDETTGTKYRVYITNAKLTMEVVN